MGDIREQIADLRKAASAPAEPQPLYVSRKVLNADEVAAWARSQGIATVLDDLHVTEAFSRAPVDWSRFTPKGDTLTLPASTGRTVHQFDKGAVVLKVQDGRLHDRWAEFLEGGASWDHPDYQPHITLTYAEGVDLDGVEPYDGVIVLGPETFEPLDTAKEKIEKAKWWNRHPAGSSKGGQFAPKGVAGGGGAKQSRGGIKGLLDDLMGSIAPPTAPEPLPGHVASMFGQSKAWEPKAPPEPYHAKPRTKVAAKHRATDDYGKPVYIQKPTKPGDPAAWGDKDATATITPGGKHPDSLNGVPMKRWAGVKDWTKVPGQNPDVEAGLPPLSKSLRPAAGVIIEEPDGRIWLTRPTNSFGGYRHTFPKGSQEKGLTLQQTAIKEAWEETGLKIEITGVLGDFKRTTSQSRFYLARRVGGSPSDMGWESQALRLAPRAKLKSLLNREVDFDIVDTFDEEEELGKAKSPDTFLGTDALDALVARMEALGTRLPLTKAKGGGSQHWKTQQRWPGGTPLGGQWKAYDSVGIPSPPSVGSKANPQHQKKVDAAYSAAAQGEYHLVQAAFDALTPKAVKDGGFNPAKGTYATPTGKNSQQKWTLQTHQYLKALLDEKAGKTQETAAKAPKAPVEGKGAHDAKGGSGGKGAASIPNLSDYKKIGGQGGSNPGGVYEGPAGKVYVKGSAAHSGALATFRAANEVLASKLAQAAGAGAVDVDLINLGKEHGGGIGVMTKWKDGTPLASIGGDLKQMAIAKVQGDFAVHAWLANYDVIGPDKQNTKMVNGEAVNIDLGGALLFRAQGGFKNGSQTDTIKGLMPHTVGEWDSLRNAGVNAAAASVYGSMTKTQLAASAEKLKAMDNATIKALVDAHGPGGATAKGNLTQALIARRDDILVKAGLQPLGNASATGVAVKPEKAEPSASSAEMSASVAISGGRLKPTGAGGAFSEADIKAINEATGGKLAPSTWADFLNGKVAGTPGSTQWEKDKADLASSTWQNNPTTAMAVNSALAQMAAKEAAAGGKGASTMSRVSASAVLGMHGVPADTPMGKQVLAAVAALNAGDDKAMASAMGSIAMMGGNSINDMAAGPSKAQQVVDDLTALAMAHGNMPLSSGDAATITTGGAPQTRPGPGNPPTAANYEKGGKSSPEAWAKAAEKLTEWHTKGDIKQLTSVAETFADISAGPAGPHSNTADLANYGIHAAYAASLANDLAAKAAAKEAGSGGKHTHNFAAPKFTKGTASEKDAAKMALDLLEATFASGDLAQVSSLKDQFSSGAQMGLTAAAKDAAAKLAEHAQKLETVLTLQQSGAPAVSDLPAIPPPPAKPVFSGHAVKYYDGLADKMEAAYLAGDAAGLSALAMKKDGTPVWQLASGKTSANGEKIKAHYEALAAAVAPHSTAAAAEKVEAAITMPKVRDVPKPGEAKPPAPAMPNFEAKKMPGETSNAKTFNGKIEQIAQHALGGDVQGIVAMGFGTNTYGKKAAQIANDALAALGSDLKVTPGQKPNTHGALTGGLKPDVAAAVMANAGKGVDPKAFAPAKGKIVPKLEGDDLPALTQFVTDSATGAGISSKPHVNKANQQAQQKLVDMAKAGDFAGVKAATFHEIDKDTGQRTGKVLPMSQHPSKHIQALHESIVQAMDEKLNPPTPLQVFEAKQAAATIKAVAAQFPPKKLGTTLSHAKSNEKLGYYIALGKVAGHEKLVPKTEKNFSPKQTQQGYDDYKKMSSDARSFITNIQSSSAMNHAYRAGQKSYNGKDLRTLAKAAHQYARKQPAGTKIYGWKGMSAQMLKDLSKAGPGLVFQDVGPNCMSKHPTATSGFGKHLVEVVFAEGAKAINSFGSGSFAGEQEVSTLPGTRFILLEHKQGNAKYGSSGTTTRLLMLPPDPDLDSDGWVD